MQDAVSPFISLTPFGRYPTATRHAYRRVVNFVNFVNFADTLKWNAP